MNNEKENTQVSLGDKVVGEVELPKLNVDEFLGKDELIEKIEEHKGSYGYYIKVFSSVISKVNDKDIRASRVFGLVTLDDGTIGWGSESKLAGFLKKHNVSHYNDLIGKPIKITKTMANSNGEEFLTF